ncbi:ABC transporter substrate-binding protein [Lacticaseibacillus kribbianus]|uniref:ABC transporter substrate-binding protein n=1 Tax=Lacticaseibacillus kribbianus TaxID=2926292 RepID=UPI001CD66D9E|nr:ABC transporter substrate-binding protein [Lacticaseibacillus kribbianus]
MKKSLLGLGTLLVATLLVACAPKESSLKESSSSAPKTAKKATAKTVDLTIGTMSAPESIPLYVAAEKGYFKDQNLNVTLQNFKSPKERDAAVSAGQLDGTVTDVVTLAAYENGKLDWRIATGLNGSFGILTNQPDIKTVADLRGKTVATMPHQTPTFYLDQELAKVGMSEKDVKLSEVAQIPARIQLCLDRKIDAMIVPDPFMAIAKSKGARVIAQSDPIDYQTTILAIAPSLAKNAGVAKRVLAAYNQAVKTLNDGTAADFQDILTKDIGYPAPLAKNVKLVHYTDAHAVQTSVLKDAFAYAKAEGVTATTLDPASVSLP